MKFNIKVMVRVSLVFAMSCQLCLAGTISFNNSKDSPPSMEFKQFQLRNNAESSQDLLQFTRPLSSEPIAYRTSVRFNPSNNIPWSYGSNTKQMFNMKTLAHVNELESNNNWDATNESLREAATQDGNTWRLDNEMENKYDEMLNTSLKKTLDGMDNSRDGRFIIVIKNGDTTNDDGKSWLYCGKTEPCLSARQCIVSEKGKATGVCLLGLGVCCKLPTELCSKASTLQETVFSSPGYPGAINATTFESKCELAVTLIDDNIVQLRIDIHDMDLEKPAEDNGVCQGTSMTILSGAVHTANLPQLCGQNNGQHLYVEVDKTVNPQVTILINKLTLQSRWAMTVTQIGKDSSDRAPEACLQYYKGNVGEVKSFNYDGEMHLANLNYAVCFESRGYKKITYKFVGDNTPNDDCMYDYLTIPDGQYNGMFSSQYCFIMGLITPITPLEITSLLTPFKMHFVSDGTAGKTTIGFQFGYTLEK